MPKDELEKVMASKFFCPAKFAEEVESLVLENKDMNYIDAIVHFCEQNNIDYLTLPSRVKHLSCDKEVKGLEQFIVKNNDIILEDINTRKPIIRISLSNKFIAKNFSDISQIKFEEGSKILHPHLKQILTFNMQK